MYETREFGTEEGARTELFALRLQGVRVSYHVMINGWEYEVELPDETSPIARLSTVRSDGPSGS